MEIWTSLLLVTITILVTGDNALVAGRHVYDVGNTRIWVRLIG